MKQCCHFIPSENVSGYIRNVLVYSMPTSEDAMRPIPIVELQHFLGQTIKGFVTIHLLGNYCLHYLHHVEKETGEDCTEHLYHPRHLYFDTIIPGYLVQYVLAVEETHSDNQEVDIVEDDSNLLVKEVKYALA